MERAILTPLNTDVARINQRILDMCPGIEEERLSYDSMDKSNEFFDIIEDHLYKMTEASFPPHRLRLKEGVPVMLLRNMGGHDGACNGTQLIVKHIGQHVLVTEFARGQHKGQILALPRIPLSPSDSVGSIKWIRRQFPVKL